MSAANVAVEIRGMSRMRLYLHKIGGNFCSMSMHTSSKRAPKAAICVVGNEVLSGKASLCIDFGLIQIGGY